MIRQLNHLSALIIIFGAICLSSCQPVPEDQPCPEPNHNLAVVQELCDTNPSDCSKVQSSITTHRVRCGANAVVVWQGRNPARVLAYELTNQGECDILIDIHPAGRGVHIHGVIKPGQRLRGSAKNVQKVTMNCQGEEDRPCVLKAALGWL